MQEKKTQTEFMQHQQQYLDLIQEFFEDDVVPYEMFLFVSIVLARGTSEGILNFLMFHFF